MAIIMTSGRHYVADDPADDSCPSCMCGSPKYVGKFAVEVWISGSKPVGQNLNALIGEFDELMFWARPWQIVFDDYNQDGRKDFNLGQYASCNGWAYRLLTVGPDGHVSQLKVEEGNPDSEIFASDDANSTRLIRHTTDGFYTRGYFNAADPVGFYTSYYVWNPKQRLFSFGKMSMTATRIRTIISRAGRKLAETLESHKE
jgi:hypothetical protein